MTTPTNPPTAGEIEEIRQGQRQAAEYLDHSHCGRASCLVCTTGTLLACIDHLEEAVAHLSTAHRSCNPGCDRYEDMRGLARRVKGQEP